MTRREEIELAANACEAEDHWSVPSFVHGAEWADANPSDWAFTQMKINLEAAVETLEFISTCGNGSAPMIAAEARAALTKIKVCLGRQWGGHLPPEAKAKAGK